MDIVIASDQDRENLFAEIHFKDQPWAEVIYDPQEEQYVVTFFPPEARESWPTFSVAEFRRALLDAKNALVARGYPDLPL